MPTPLQPVLRSDDFEMAGLGSRELRRLAERGVMTRVVPGAYINADTWSGMPARDQYVTLVHERTRRLSSAVCVSHWSAAAIWGFLVPNAWPCDVQVIDPTRQTSNRIETLHRRPGVLLAGDVVAWQSVSVTTPARTAADLALSEPFENAVLVFDFGLRTKAFTVQDVEWQLGRRPDAHRRRSAAAALDFASPEAEWPGESFSRVGMATRGVATPSLQEPFFDSAGKIGRVDFWWEAVGIAGEFDGHWKYTDPEFLRGRTAAEAIRDEKRRQARLEAHPRITRIVRWDYPVARNADELARRLRAAGVPDR